MSSLSDDLIIVIICGGAIAGYYLYIQSQKALVEIKKITDTLVDAGQQVGSGFTNIHLAIPDVNPTPSQVAALIKNVQADDYLDTNDKIALTG
jgi:hypothetical protein